ncbi:MAG: PhoU domain-containing protein [Candidatus Omnitrophota bacterium]
MADLETIKGEVVKMAFLTLKMWQTTFKTFMEHDLDLLAEVLKDEDRLNNYEKEINTGLINLVKATNGQTKQSAVIYADVTGDLELIGDYCKDILERVQIKIEERLLFSDEAVKEYIALYNIVENELKKLVDAFSKDEVGVLKELSQGHKGVNNLVDDYRRRHTERVIEGVCSPMSCNMYINMLDFTAEVYHHTKNIARNLAKIKS